MSFAIWMSRPIGRLVRIVAGVVLIGIGLYVQGPLGVVIAAVGVVPILAGVFNFCVLAPILGCPLSGRRLTSGA